MYKTFHSNFDYNTSTLSDKLSDSQISLEKRKIWIINIAGLFYIRIPSLLFVKVT